MHVFYKEITFKLSLSINSEIHKNIFESNYLNTMIQKISSNYFYIIMQMVVNKFYMNKSLTLLSSDSLYGIPDSNFVYYRYVTLQVE